MTSDSSVQETIDLQLFPRDPHYWATPEEWKNYRILVYDPSHRLDKQLSAMGMTFQSLPKADRDTLPQADVLVVAVGNGSASEAEIMERQLSRKGSVVLIEPQKIPDVWPVHIQPGPVDTGSITCHSTRLPHEVVPPYKWASGRECAAQSLLLSAEQAKGVMLWLGPCPLPGRPWTKPVTALAALIPFREGNLVLNELAILDHFEDEPLASWWLVQVINRALRASDAEPIVQTRSN